MKIGTVVEGPTDRLLLEAVISHVCPGNHSFFPLQPRDLGETFGDKGTGWKGVRQFCLSELTAFVFDFVYDHNFDLLVIHVDADVSNESDLQEGTDKPIVDVSQPCPPVSSTITKLREVIIKWLQVEDALLPPQVVFAIPAQDSEHWVFAALFPDDELCQAPDYECFNRNIHQRPAYKLSLSEYGRILRRKDGKIKKSAIGYRAVLPDVIKGWDKACEICTQAKVFTDDLANVSQRY